MAEQPALGKAIRAVRETLNLTQRSLADAADVSPNYIAMVERGERCLSQPMLLVVADALGLTPSELNVLGTNDLEGELGELLKSMQHLILAAIEEEASDFH